LVIRNCSRLREVNAVYAREREREDVATSQVT